jgi:hypothetical protein
MYAPLVPGKIVEINERVFLVDKLIYDEDGELERIQAKCLTPKDGDTSEWFTLEITDECLIPIFTLQ